MFVCGVGCVCVWGLDYWLCLGVGLIVWGMGLVNFLYSSEKSFFHGPGDRRRVLGGASPISPAVASMIRTLPLAAALPTLSLSLLGLQSRSWFLILSSVSFGIVLGPPPGFHRGSSLLRRCDLDLLL